MKKLLYALIALFASSLALRSQSVTFTNVTGTNSLSCTTPSINVIASLTSGPASFTWSTGTYSYVGTSATLTLPGTYSVMAAAGGSTFVSTFTVFGSNTGPTVTLTPAMQSMSCLIGAITVTALTSSGANTTGHWSIGGATFVTTGSPSYYTPGGPGVYSYCVTDNITGCSSCQNYTVTSTDNFPTITLTSLDNYTLGCGSHSLIVVYITGDTQPTGGGVTYGIHSSANPGSGPGNNTQYSVTIPGNYLGYIHTTVGGCVTSLPFTVTSNTTVPAPICSIPTQTLSCNLPSVVVSATGSNSSVQWLTPSGIGGGSVVAVSTIAPASSSLAGNYTVVSLNPVNSCTASSVIPFYQNVFPPNASISSGSLFTLTCNNSSVQLINTSNTGIPFSSGFPTNSLVATTSWQGPGPGNTGSPGFTYAVQVPGVYTLTVQDLNNGCSSQATTTVLDSRDPLVATQAFTISCPDASVIIYPSVTGATTGLTYSWSAPGNPTAGSANSASLVVSAPGIYTVVVNNPQNGCSSTALIPVEACMPTGIAVSTAASSRVQVFPNPGNGLYTLAVNNAGDNTSIAVYNALGILVLQQAADVKETQLHLENEPNGVYIISVSSKNKITYTSKIIKQ